MAETFHRLLDLTKEVHVKGGKIGTKEFLEVCLQVIPVIGTVLSLGCSRFNHSIILGVRPSAPAHRKQAVGINCIP